MLRTYGRAGGVNAAGAAAAASGAAAPLPGAHTAPLLSEIRFVCSGIAAAETVEIRRAESLALVKCLLAQSADTALAVGARGIAIDFDAAVRAALAPATSAKRGSGTFVSDFKLHWSAGGTVAAAAAPEYDEEVIGALLLSLYLLASPKYGALLDCMRPVFVELCLVGLQLRGSGEGAPVSSASSPTAGVGGKRRHPDKVMDASRVWSPSRGHSISRQSSGSTGRSGASVVSSENISDLDSVFLAAFPCVATADSANTAIKRERSSSTGNAPAFHGEFPVLLECSPGRSRVQGLALYLVLRLVHVSEIGDKPGSINFVSDADERKLAQHVRTTRDAVLVHASGQGVRLFAAIMRGCSNATSCAHQLSSTAHVEGTTTTLPVWLVERNEEARLLATLTILEDLSLVAAATSLESAAGAALSGVPEERTQIERFLEAFPEGTADNEQSLISCLLMVANDAARACFQPPVSRGASAAEVLQGCLRVLVNSTNNSAGGIRALVTPERGAEASRGLPPAMCLMCSVFEQASKAATLSASAFDTTVLSLGVLINCVEHSDDAVACVVSEANGSVMRWVCSLFTTFHDNVPDTAAEAEAGSSSSSSSALVSNSESADALVLSAYAALVLTNCMRARPLAGVPASSESLLFDRSRARQILDCLAGSMRKASGWSDETSGASTINSPPLASSAKLQESPTMALRHSIRVFALLQSVAGLLSEDAAQNFSDAEALCDALHADSLTMSVSGPIQSRIQSRISVPVSTLSPSSPLDANAVDAEELCDPVLANPLPVTAGKTADSNVVVAASRVSRVASSALSPSSPLPAMSAGGENDS